MKTKCERRILPKKLFRRNGTNIIFGVMGRRRNGTSVLYGVKLWYILVATPKDFREASKLNGLFKLFLETFTKSRKYISAFNNYVTLFGKSIAFNSLYAAWRKVKGKALVMVKEIEKDYEQNISWIMIIVEINLNNCKTLIWSIYLV